MGTKLLYPSPPDRLRKSAKRWVTHVAVLHARFCTVVLLKNQIKNSSEMHSIRLLYIPKESSAKSVKFKQKVISVCPVEGAVLTIFTCISE